MVAAREAAGVGRTYSDDRGGKERVGKGGERVRERGRDCGCEREKIKGRHEIMYEGV